MGLTNTFNNLLDRTITGIGANLNDAKVKGVVQNSFRAASLEVGGRGFGVFTYRVDQGEPPMLTLSDIQPYGLSGRKIPCTKEQLPAEFFTEVLGKMEKGTTVDDVITGKPWYNPPSARGTK